MIRRLAPWLAGPEGLIRSKRGTAAMEFAFVVPVLLALAAAVVECGGIFRVYNGVDRLASQYASAWSDCVDAPALTCLTELSTYTAPATVSNIAPQLTSTPTVQMFQVTMLLSVPTVTYPPLGSLTADQITAARAVLIAGQTGVIVTVTYQHTLRFFSTLATPYLGTLLQPSYTIVQLKS